MPLTRRAGISLWETPTKRDTYDPYETECCNQADTPMSSSRYRYWAPPIPCVDNCAISDAGLALVRHFAGYYPFVY